MEEFKVESPLGGLNWGIGCIAQVKEGDGFWESYGTPVQPRSLYLQQLKDRLGEQAVLNITSEEQRNGNIRVHLADWAGNEPEGVNINEMHDPTDAIRIYPNPADEHFFVDLRKLSTTMLTIELYDLQGKCISNQEIRGGNTLRLNIPEQIKNALLLIRISGENISLIKKIRIK